MMTEKITSNRRKQIVRFVEDGIDAMNLQKDGAQRLIENGGEFQSELKKLVERFSITNQYANEEVESNYGYLSGYKPNIDQRIELIIANFQTQIEVLDRHFNCGPKFNPDWIAKAYRTLPNWVEKFFAQFDWRLIASTYGEAVELVLKKLSETRNGAFCNYREGKLDDPDHLRQLQKSVVLFGELNSLQKVDGIKCDVIATPAQFGLRHGGRSVRRASEVMNANECGLGAFAIGTMLLTHPERLQHYDDLWIDCGGDEFAPDASGGFGGLSRSPYFEFNVSWVEFGADGVDVASSRYGSASVCLPQG